MVLLQKISMSDSFHRSFIIQERRRYGKPIQMVPFSAGNNIALCALLFALLSQLSRFSRNDDRTGLVSCPYHYLSIAGSSDTLPNSMNAVAPIWYIFGIRRKRGHIERNFKQFIDAKLPNKTSFTVVIWVKVK